MRPIVLMYHDVYAKDITDSGFCTPGALHYKISSDVFEEHLKSISAFCVEKNIDKENVVFTFDDGGRSFYSIIAPMLEKYGWFGYFFISTNYIGTKGFLNVDQIKELRKRGHIVGSHSHHHKVLTELSIEEVEIELEKSKKMLSDILNEQIDSISIPNGCYSKDILDVVIKTRFKYIYTSKPTTRMERLMSTTLIGRYAIIYTTSAEDVIRLLSSSFLRFKMECKYQILQFVKQLLGSYYSKIKMKIRKYFIK